MARRISDIFFSFYGNKEERGERAKTGFVFRFCVDQPDIPQRVQFNVFGQIHENFDLEGFLSGQQIALGQLITPISKFGESSNVTIKLPDKNIHMMSF